MYPITSAVKALFESEQRQTLRITGTDRNGTAISITEENVIQGGFSIDRYSCNGEKLEIGTAIAAELTLKLDNREGQYDGVVFEGAELFVEIGIADWTLSSPTVYYIPCGYFTPDEQPRSLSTITLHALDRMARFDDGPLILSPWEDGRGNVMTDGRGNTLYFVSELSFPCTVTALVKQICAYCNVPFTQSVSALPNASYTISALPELQQEISFRNLIQWCAGMMGANAWIDWTGSLRFSWYGASTGYTTTTANRFSSDLHEDDITITGVTYTNTQGATIVSGDDAYALDMTGNYLAATGIAQILPNVKNAINGFTYRPLEATVINAPYLWPMDMITFTDKDGVDHPCALTNVNFGINGGTALQGKGETAQSNSGKKPSSVSSEEARLIEGASEVAKQLDKSLDQEGIFNRLTDNGAAQGLLLYNGDVYLNASYINSGVVKAEYIDADNLHVKAANVDGTLVIGQLPDDVAQTGDIPTKVSQLSNDSGYQNATQVTTITNDTIKTTNVTATNLKVKAANIEDTLSASKIKGDTLTLGGANNANGKLIILDGKGNEIGEWDNTGIDISKGDIELDSSSKLVSYFDDEKTQYTKFDKNGFMIAQPYNTIRTNHKKGYSGGYPYTPSKSSSDQITVKMFSLEYVLSSSEWWECSITPFDLEFTTASQSGAFAALSNHELNVSDGSDNNVRIYCNGTYSYARFHLPVTVYDDFTVNGTKSRAVSTDQYSERLLYCYETPSPMFGDVGEGVIGEDGKCYIWLDPVFAQTVTTDQYQVFLQRYGPGDCWVAERRGGCFVVEGEPGLAFGWEVKAKQSDFDQLRLEKNEDRFTVPAQTYGADAAQHIDDIQKGRITA